MYTTATTTGRNGGSSSQLNIPTSISWGYNLRGRAIMIGPSPLFRVVRIIFTTDRKAKALQSNALMTWDSAWDYFWNLNSKGYTAWVEPA